MAGRYSSAVLSPWTEKRISWWRRVGPGSFTGFGFRIERLAVVEEEKGGMGLKGAEGIFATIWISCSVMFAECTSGMISVEV